MKINITPEQEAKLRSGKTVTIDSSALPPRVTVYVNSWGRLTYKTTEAIRVYRNEPNSVFFSGYSYPARLGNDYKVYPKLLTLEVLRENVIGLTGSIYGRDLKERGMELTPLNVLCIQYNYKAIVVDEPLLSLSYEQLLTFLRTVAAHAPETIHIYQRFDERVINDMTRYLKGKLPDIDFDFVVNTRSTPSDVARSLETECG
jgi:hypothetical protein